MNYAEQPILTEDIQKVDDIYLWYVALKEEAIRTAGRGPQRKSGI